MELIAIILLIAGLLLGYIIGYYQTKSSQALTGEEAVVLQKEREEAMQKVSRLEERNKNVSEQLDESKDEHTQARKRADHAENALSALKADYSNLQERLADQKEEMENLQERFKDEFENLANKILEEKSEKFTKQNKEKLDQILKPLGEKMEAFKKSVEESHKEDLKGRSALGKHLEQLKELNQQMNEEAQNLTKALKGDTKTQGSWGEIILERILERSGLKKGREYDVQVSRRDDDQRLKKPDAVVYLPDDKYLVVDSKVSLKAYDEFISADDNKKQSRFLNKHLTSIRSHVRELSEKNYQHLFEEKTPDFVLMFIPIESAFGAAFQTDPALYNYAFERNIVIVSPSTLLATLATINNVWKREYQNQNAQQIAERGGKLYDKFVLFVESLEKIGDRIRQSQKSYDTAINRLKNGRGNLIGQADKLRKLGAPNSKKLSERYTNRQPPEDEDEDE